MLAFDRESKRKIDANGFLHVSISHISKETVNQYIGSSIPGYKELGLDPTKIYNCYRKGSELKAGAESFNGLPILWGHKAESAESPNIKDRIGNMGTDAKFNPPYLDNSLIFNTKRGIDAIESGERVELSCSYRWTPVIQSGTFNGMPYDIIMTNIIGNHLGLVEEGRAGSDVMVHDSKDKDIDKSNSFKLPKKENKIMEEKEKKTMDADEMKAAFGKMSKDEQNSYMEELKKIMKAKKEEPEKEKAKDEEPEEKKEEKKAKESYDQEEKKEEKKAEDKAMSPDEVKKLVMDAKEEATQEITAKHKALTAAAKDVKPVVGNLDALSFDSPDDLYKKALDLQGIKTDDFEPSAYRGMFAVLKANKSSKVAMAHDEKKPELTGAFSGLKNVNIGV